MTHIKKIILVAVLMLWLAPGVSAQDLEIPQYRGYVNDYAGIISAGDERQITQFAGELEQKTSAQLAVVTLPSTQPETIEGYAVRLFEAWGIGRKGEDNGVLLLVAKNDRRVRIEVGYGLEGTLTDAASRMIIESYIIPFFKRGDFSKGTLQGAVGVISLAAQHYDVEITGQEQQFARGISRRPSALSRIINFIFTIAFFLLLMSGRGGFLGWFLLGSMVGGRRRGGSWHGSGFGGSSGGFSGGFGGFGGGMSGGGGASGGW